jgi:Bacterial PH domain
MDDHDFDFEPIPGLPRELPPGEQMLWQGSPDFKTTLMRTFHVQGIGAYFTALALWQSFKVADSGAGFKATLSTMSWYAVLAAVAVGLLALLARSCARTTVYTITSKRVVMRFGMALPITLNIPFSKINSAGLKLHRDGTGDIPLTLMPGSRFGYSTLWPHARPWMVRQPQPMLRGLVHADVAAEILTAALRATANQVAAQSKPAAEMAKAPLITSSISASIAASVPASMLPSRGEPVSA